MNMYSSKIKTFFVFVIVSLILLLNLKYFIFQNDNSRSQIIFSVIYDYPGYDAAYIENHITDIIESRLSSITNLSDILSVSENDRATFYLYFPVNLNPRNLYLSISRCCKEIEPLLPQDIHKPLILSAADDDKPIFSFTIDADMEWIKKDLQPKIESIDGVSQVILSGNKENHIELQFEPVMAQSFNFNPMIIAEHIAEYSLNDYLIQNNYNFMQSVLIKNNFSIEDFDKTSLKSDSINHLVLKNYFSIKKQHNQPSSIVKVNGKECICIDIKTSSQALSYSISGQIKKILKKLPEKSSPVILYDSSSSYISSITNLCISLILCFIINCAVIYYFYKSFYYITVSLIFIITDIIFTICIMVFCKIPVSPNTMSGIIISIGLVIDNLLLVLHTNAVMSHKLFFTKIKSVIPESILSTLTSCLSLVPVFFLEFSASGISSLVIPVLIMLIVSFFLSFVFCPVIIYKTKVTPLPQSNIQLSKLLNCTKFFISHKKLSVKIIILFTVLPVLFLLILPKSIEYNSPDKILYLSAEYKPEQSAQSIDNDIQEFINTILKNKNIINVISDSKRGQAEIKILYKNNKAKIIKFLNENKYLISTGNLYIPEIQPDKKTMPVKIAVCGNENYLCQEYAKTACKELLNQNLALQGILNFKQNEKTYKLIPDSEYITLNSLDIYELSSILRWNYFNPVISKKIINGKETDIKISSTTIKPGKTEILNTTLPGNIITSKAFKLTEENTPPRIFHKNMKRCAEFTIEIPKDNLLKQVKQIKKILQTVSEKAFNDTNDNYIFYLPAYISDLKYNYICLSVSLIVSIALIFLFIGAANQKIKTTLKIIISIPLSLFLPLLLKIVTFSSIESGDIIAMVILSGSCINNAIYISQSSSADAIEKVKSKLDCILITSLTTILSALPMIFLAASSFSRQLAFFTFWGTIGSLFTAIVLFPSLLENSE